MGAVPDRRRRVRMVAWSSAWLVVLLAPAQEIAHGRNQPAVLAGALLLSFVGLYLALLWLASDPNHQLRDKLVLLAPLAAIALGGSLAYAESWPFLFIFLSAAVACALPERWVLFGVVGVTVLDAVVVTRPSLGELNMGPQIFGVFMAGVVVMFIIRLLRLITELNAAREELAQLAVADERLRFSRDLHDLLGHTLSLIVVKSEAVRRLVHHDADAAARESGDIEQVSRQALVEVREAVTNYRDRSLEAELEGARLALSAAGIEAVINRPDFPLPDAVENVLGWTVREGITNVVRHSNGRHCAIDLRQANGIAVLEISDDGNDGLGPRGRAPLGNRPGSAATVGASRGSDPGSAPAAGGGASGAGAGGAGTADGVGGGAGAAEGGGASGASGAGTADGVGGGAGAAEGGGASGAGWDGPGATAGGVGVASGAGGDRLGGALGRGGSGLRGLAERLAAAHGRLEAGRRPDGGFRLSATVPLRPEGRGPA